MREIKFRAWDKDETQWLNIKHFGFDDKELWYVQAIDENEKDIDPPYFVEYNEIELMQYTGLKDKNGKEIYEGDILQTTQYPCSPVDDYVLVVEYDIDRFWGVRTMKANATVRGISNGIADGLYEFLDEELEVIGNIYENPELINK